MSSMQDLQTRMLTGYPVQIRLSGMQPDQIIKNFRKRHLSKLFMTRLLVDSKCLLLEPLLSL